MMNMVVSRIAENAAPFLDDMDAWIGPDHPVRIIGLFVDTLHLSALGFQRPFDGEPRSAGLHPAVMLKLFIFGYVNRIPSGRRLAREVTSNIECVWLLGHQRIDRRQIASFRQTNRTAIVQACTRFLHLWKKIQTTGEPADKAQPAHAAGSLQRQQAKVLRYLAWLDRVDTHEDSATNALRLNSENNQERRLQQDILRIAAGHATNQADFSPVRPTRRAPR